MLFNSFDFFIFFPIAVIGYYVIPYRIKHIWLLLCSYYFYMCWNPAYAVLILISTLITYASGILIEKKPRLKKVWVFASFALNLGILGYFKYFNFFLDNLNMLFDRFHITMELPRMDFLLPVGISFYTFQALSYTMDVYRKEIAPEKNLFKYALFVSFFPQLVAGPIERSGNLLKQISEKHKFDPETVRDGLMLMIWGYFLKLVLADRIAIFVDAVFSDYTTYGGAYILVADLLFTIQIYCDFAGYSTIAMGAAKVMGFQLTDNFDCPYMAESIAEHWRRWHITLSSWFRDYVYIPLGGNRKGKRRKYINIFIVFLLSGLWHGAAWTYVIWGALHGIYQIIGEILMPLRDRLNKILRLNRNSFSHRLYHRIGTFLLIAFAFVFFRADTVRAALQILKSIVCMDNLYVLFDDSLFGLGLDWKNFMVMLLAIGLLLAVDALKHRGFVVREWICRQELWFRWSILIAGIVGILIFGIWGFGYDAQAFIYFQF